jgi:hypothetical protein
MIDFSIINQTEIISISVGTPKTFAILSAFGRQLFEVGVVCITLSK